MKCYIVIEEKTFNDGSVLIGAYTNKEKMKKALRKHLKEMDDYYKVIHKQFDEAGVLTYLEIDTHPRDSAVYKVYHHNIE